MDLSMRTLHSICISVLHMKKYKSELLCYSLLGSVVLMTKYRAIVGALLTWKSLLLNCLQAYFDVSCSYPSVIQALLTFN